MAEQTSDTQDVSRTEAAELLQELASELRGDGHADVRVGNKMLTLSPASVVEYAIEAEERSPMLGSPHEEITISLSWTIEDGEDV
ncbi:amphi-Trp domain-containing protein [Natronobeatus ordinarius]|uniref:amphi-Trp domain-containing protein n=1 Tax=Natronobeatus ordinarius TaxID=2963433 RepID=UPI0020CBEAA9|nr:amphi-Trp domain-containing protein [Natronobeatus ordinarius]